MIISITVSMMMTISITSVYDYYYTIRYYNIVYVRRGVGDILQ